MLLLQSLAGPSANCFVTLTIKTAGPNNLWIYLWWRYIYFHVKRLNWKKQHLRHFQPRNYEQSGDHFLWTNSSAAGHFMTSLIFASMFWCQHGLWWLSAIREKYLFLHIAVYVWFYWLTNWGCWTKPLPTKNSTLK